MTAPAKNGDTVKVHYTGRLEDGTVFDSTDGREPITFEIGAGNLIPGFEEAVLGMNAGESKTIRLTPEQAFGLWFEENVIEVPKAHLEGELNIEVGQQMQVKRNDGATITVFVTDIKPESITLDANHPLAGKALDFDISLVEIL